MTESITTCGARVTIEGVRYRCGRIAHRDGTHRVGNVSWSREAGSWMRREVQR